MKNEKVTAAVSKYENDRMRGIDSWGMEASGCVLDMARGGDGYGVRDQYYPDWTDQDFADLWIAMGEDPDAIF